jgi:Mrp family chromosome partitioning ATPase
MDLNNQKMVLANNEENQENKEQEEQIPSVYKPYTVNGTSLMSLSITDEVIVEGLDESIIAPRFYNNFNFSKLAVSNHSVTLALGITSANRREGKTLVAANMAVSLAQAYHQRTVLVDLNFVNPELHKVFGLEQSPGLSEAMQHHLLHVSATQVDNLYLLTSGQLDDYMPGIRDTLTLRNILFTLKNEFDFIIVDLSSVFPIEEFPIHFLNEMDGLITVVDSKSTKTEHLENIFKHVDEHRFWGYIFNRFKGE